MTQMTQTAATHSATGVAHRSNNPVHTAAQDCITTRRIDPAVMAAAEAMAGPQTLQVVPQADREVYRATTTLSEFYADWMRVERVRQAARGCLSSGTLAKDSQTLNRWLRYTRPDNWPEESEWPGPPLSLITGRMLEGAFDRATCGSLSGGSIQSWWYSLRTMLNEAVRRRAIDICPKPRLDLDHGSATEVWSEQQLAVAYESLSVFPDLQVAFVLACQAGIRPVDLFLLEWDGIGETHGTVFVSFTARKTGKQQRVPLNETTYRHLQRLPRFADQTLLWPARSASGAKDPERSRRARTRNGIVKELFEQVGLNEERPWQRCRRTCNERLEQHSPGAGQFVLGHALSLNSRSYRDPSNYIVDAVNTVPVPECFRLS